MFEGMLASSCITCQCSKVSIWSECAAQGRPVCTMPSTGAVSSLIFCCSQQLLLAAGEALYQYTLKSQADGVHKEDRICLSATWQGST